MHIVVLINVVSVGTKKAYDHQFWFLCMSICKTSIFNSNGNFDSYLFTVNGGFLTRLWFKEKKFVIQKVVGPQFLSNLPLAVNKSQLKFTLV